jgi:uncharacterized cysteine cluster protein YcgN (CxxCxxCC family)
MTVPMSQDPRPKPAAPEPFWKTKRLGEMTRREWESLCDGCGRCCLNKLEDIDTGATYFTNVRCRLFDTASCRCKDYAHRKARVPDCVQLKPRNVRRIVWLPPTCAYRLVAEGKDLMWWHHLVSGSRETVHEAGVSVRGKDTVCETALPEEKWPERIVSWPGKVPKAARGSKR